MKTKVRKSEDIKKAEQERAEKRQQKITEEENWYKFWEKNSEVNLKKLKKGGFKKPKPFRYEPTEYVPEDKSIVKKDKN